MIVHAFKAVNKTYKLSCHKNYFFYFKSFIFLFKNHNGRAQLKIDPLNCKYVGKRLNAEEKEEEEESEIERKTVFNDVGTLIELEQILG